MDPVDVKEIEAVHMCMLLEGSCTPDNLQIVSECLAQFGGTVASALEHGPSWQSWRDLLSEIEPEPSAGPDDSTDLQKQRLRPRARRQRPSGNKTGGGGNSQPSGSVPRGGRRLPNDERTADVRSMMGIASDSTTIWTPSGDQITVYFPFMLFNGDILVRILSSLQPAVVSLAMYMAAREGKVLRLAQAGPNSTDLRSPDLFNALSHMTGRHMQENHYQTNSRDPGCRALRAAYFHFLVGRTGDPDEDAIREAQYNSWVDKVLDARNKLVHSKYNKQDDLVLSRKELEDVLLCSTAILEAYDPALKPNSQLASGELIDRSEVLDLRNKFQIALESIQILRPLHQMIAKARALAKLNRRQEVEELFYRNARPLDHWIVADAFRPTEANPLDAVRTTVVLPICVEEPDVWRFVATILEVHLRPLVKITSRLQELACPLWPKGPGVEDEDPDLQCILKHLRGTCRGQQGRGEENRAEVKQHYLRLLLGDGEGAAWDQYGACHSPQIHACSVLFASVL